MTFRTYLVILGLILGAEEVSSHLLCFRDIPTLKAQEFASENSKGVANDLSTFEMRTWKDASGDYSIVASFVDIESGNVQLRRQNQEIVILPLAQLCSADQEYVKFHSNPDNLLLSAFGIDSYSKLEDYCKSHRNPQEIVDLIQAFIECEALPIEVRDRAKLLLPKWLAIVSEKRVLFGKQWVSQSEYDRIIAEESKLLKEAWKLIDAGQDKAAQERLDQASKIHPLSIRADFTLGLMHALIHRHAAKAEAYFNECVKRQSSFSRPVEDVSTSNLAAALNNLAITEIRQAKHKDAFKHLREAARLNPSSPEILQNVGRYSEMVKSQRLKSVPPSMHEDLSNLWQ